MSGHINERADNTCFTLESRSVVGNQGDTYNLTGCHATGVPQLATDMSRPKLLMNNIIEKLSNKELVSNILLLFN